MILYCTRDCTATCLPSFQFPGGATELKISCDNGDWRPDTGDQVLDCQGSLQTRKHGNLKKCFYAAKCSPPCENGGTCLQSNQCQCGETYRGAQCQYGKENIIEFSSLQLHSFCGRNVPVFPKQTELQWWLQLHW